jgi:hypothetical protein
MPVCPDCGGGGFRLFLNPIPDRTDPGPTSVLAGSMYVPCARCHQTGSVPDAPAAGPPPDVQETPPKTSWWRRLFE